MVILPDQTKRAIAADFREHGDWQKTAQKFNVGETTVRKYAGHGTNPALDALQAQLDALRETIAPAPTVHPGRYAPPDLSLVTEHAQGLYTPKKTYERILVLSDLHVPYHDRRAIDAVLDFARDFAPDLIVLNGDTYDSYLISRYGKDPKKLRDTLQSEFDAAQPILKRINSLFGDVILGLGNHDARINALVAENPGLDGLRALEFGRMAELPDRWTVLPDGYRLRLGPIDVLHGNLKGRGGGAKHIAAWMYAKLKRSCLFGHFHRQQSHLEPDGDGVVRGAFSTGHLCDPVKAAEYCPINDWAAGFATIEMDGGDAPFHVGQHLISRGVFRYGGKTYGG